MAEKNKECVRIYVAYTADKDRFREEISESGFTTTEQEVVNESLKRKLEKLTLAERNVMSRNVGYGRKHRILSTQN